MPFKRKISEEHKQKISFANRGRKWSEESKKRGSEAAKKRGISSKTREAATQALIGKSMPNETRQKISATMKGCKKSEETKKRMSEAAKKLDREIIERRAATLARRIGNGEIKMPEEARGRAKGGRYKGKWMRSKWEISFAQKLDENSILWLHEPKTFWLSDGRSYKPDFFLIDLNLWVEIKGYWWPVPKAKFDLFRSEYPKIDILVIGKELWHPRLNVSRIGLSTETDLFKLTA